MSKNIISGQHNGHDFVEIAGIKWTTCNVGADKPTDAGFYFQWGDRKGYTADEIGKVKVFNIINYKHYNGKRFTKYNEFDGKRTLDLCDDAAFAYMGHGWRIPTHEEFGCLFQNTTHRWVNSYQGSGVAGLVCIDNTDSSKRLFFPAVGYCNNGGSYSVGSYGYYWSGSLNSEYASCGLYFYFYRDGMGWQSSVDRYFGFHVRGILKD